MTLMGADIRFGLLGSLEVAAGGRPVSLAGRRVRALLALLVLHANQVVSTERIIRGLWGTEPPKAARESVHYFVHQLRKVLPHAEGDRQGLLERHGGGYLLRVSPPERIDVFCFQRGVEQAGVARDRGDPEAAWKLYGEALGWWRGPALDDLAEEPFAEPEIARLTELRLVATERHFAVGLDLGLHDHLVAELDALVRANPGREELRELLMLGLYRSGRQAEALEVYQDARTALVGREPGVRLQQLQRSILTQDPALGRHPAADAPPASVQAASVVPARQVVAAAAPDPPAGAAAQPARLPVGQTSGAAAGEERRLVTALVVGIVTDPDPPASDPEVSRARTGEAMAYTATRIRHYGGVVQTTEMGRLLATFGAGHSHEDDPERAVRAALEVVAPSDERPGMAVRAGAATGEVLVIRTPDRPDEIVGDVVHVAVTLEQNARPGTVLVNAAAHQATSRRFRYVQTPSSGSLERSSGMRLWQALEPRGRTGAHVTDAVTMPLVERERELSFLSDILTRFLRDREPQFITLVADPGLGKSRLVAELGRMVDQAPELVGWRVGPARAYGQAALGPLAEVVKAEVGILDDDGPTILRKLREAVASLFGEAATPIAESLARLLGIGGDPLPAQPHALFDGWAEFFAAVAEQRPLVLVLEDLQWADDALLEFINSLVFRVGPVPLLLVCTGRPEFLDRRPDWGGGQRNALSLALAPLSPEGTGTLLDTLLAGEALPEDTREALLQAAGGNPLYVEEYVHMLAEQPTAALSADALSMPTSVQQVIAARIDTLPEDDKRLLQDAAVIGETCWDGALATVGDTDRGDVQTGLRRLDRQGFLRRMRSTSVAGQTEYIFRHTLIREVAYQQLLRADRIRRHERAARWTEQLGPEAGERIELLAYHYGRALELTRATGGPAEALANEARLAFREAGDRATAYGSLAHAARRYQEALELWPAGDPTRPEVLVQLGQALVLSEHSGEETLTRARESALDLGREDLAAQADDLLRQLALTRYIDGPAGQQHTGQWREELGKGGPTVTALGSQVVGYLIGCNYQEAIAAARTLIARARQLGLPAEEGHGLHALGEARIRTGDLGGWQEVEQGLALMDAHRSWRRMFARYGHTDALWWYGDLERCETALVAARQIAQDKDAAVSSWLEETGTALDYAAGRWDAVLDAVERYLTGVTDPGRTESWYRIVRGKIWLARGQVDQALMDAQAAAAILDVEDMLYWQPALALLGRCLLAVGREPDAVARLDELLAVQRQRPAGASATLDEGLLLVDLGYPAEALPEGLPPTRWHQAVQALVARDDGRAAEVLAAIGSRVDLAQVRLRHAQRLADAGERAGALAALEPATVVFREVGMPLDQDAAQALHRRLTAAG